MSKAQQTDEVLSEKDQVGRVALVLASWENESLERKTSNKLQKMSMITTTLSEYEYRQDSNMQKVPAPLPKVSRQLPDPGKNIDGTKLPDYPPLPAALLDSIRKIGPPFLKQFTATDVAEGQGRISLTNTFVDEHYRPMLNGDKDLKKGIRVTTYGPDGRGFPMDFKIWQDITYVLNGGWNSFRSHHELKACTYWATVWMFRDDNDHLCFALDWSVNESTTKWIAKRSKGQRTGK